MKTIKIAICLVSILLALLFLGCNKQSNNNVSSDEFPPYTEDMEAVRIQIPALDISAYVPSGLPAFKMLNAPPAISQGSLNSCVAFACAYARTFQKHTDNNMPYSNSMAISPGYLYNSQQTGNNCDFVSFSPTLKILIREGACTLSEMPYNSSSCSQKPTSLQVQQAVSNRIAGYFSLNARNVNVIKNMLYLNIMPVTSAFIDKAFKELTANNNLWLPNGQNRSGHAFCITGFDDNLYGGAFKILNSWGANWGNNGSAYIKYTDWESVAGQACYGIISGGPDITPNLLNQLAAYYPLNGNFQSMVSAPDILPQNISFVTDRKGISSNAAYMNGQNASFARNISLAAVSNFALSFWIKKENNGMLCSTIDQGLNGKNFELSINSDNKLVLKAPDNQGGWTQSVSVKEILSNEWNNIILNWDGKFLSVYVNGVMTIVRLQTQLPLQNAKLIFGFSESNLQVPFFSGVIDDIRFYERSLSVAEMSLLAGE